MLTAYLEVSYFFVTFLFLMRSIFRWLCWYRKANVTLSQWGALDFKWLKMKQCDYVHRSKTMRWNSYKTSLKLVYIYVSVCMSYRAFSSAWLRQQSYMYCGGAGVSPLTRVFVFVYTTSSFSLLDAISWTKTQTPGTLNDQSTLSTLKTWSWGVIFCLFRSTIKRFWDKFAEIANGKETEQFKLKRTWNFMNRWFLDGTKICFNPRSSFRYSHN